MLRREICHPINDKKNSKESSIRPIIYVSDQVRDKRHTHYKDDALDLYNDGGEMVDLILPADSENNYPGGEFFLDDLKFENNDNEALTSPGGESGMESGDVSGTDSESGVTDPEIVSDEEGDAVGELNEDDSPHGETKGDKRSTSSCCLIE